MSFLTVTAIVLLTLWAWRRLETGMPGCNLHGVEPWRPCWEETQEGEGGLHYGRYQCVHDDLMEMDARARRADFPIPGPSG